MKMTFTLHLVLILSGLFLNNLALANLEINAPNEIKIFTESDFDSIHNEALKTHAVPLKILLPALILEGRSRGWISKNSLDYKSVFMHTGLTYPDNMIYDKKTYAWKSDILPAGLVQKDIDFGINANIKVINLSCIACHGAREYNSQGQRTNNLIIGAPSDSFNPEIYVDILYQGVKKVTLNWDEAYELILKLFPKTGLKEKILIKTFIRMQVNSYVKSLTLINRGTPFLNGGPGLTNGVASLKNVLGLDIKEGSEDGYTSIPSIADRGFRSSLLYDGVYSVTHKNHSRKIEQVTNTELTDTTSIVALFTIPTMGQTQKRSLKNVNWFIKNISPILKTVRTPEYPGSINTDIAKRGFDIYNNSCLQCHGEYKWNEGKKSVLVSFPNVVVSQNEMKSDPERWKSISPSLVQNLEKSVWRNRVQINLNSGYVAPILEGLWASAPYMHNGSIPTLWHFLRPEQRPAKFIVGNQPLDMVKVGQATVETFGSEIYDTSLKGRDNHGHEREFNSLSEAEKDDLLEYLKTL